MSFSSFYYDMSGDVFFPIDVCKRYSDRGSPLKKVSLLASTKRVSSL